MTQAEISRLLLRAGAMIDARDHNGCTAWLPNRRARKDDWTRLPQRPHILHAKALMLAAGTGDVDGVQVGQSGLLSPW